MNPSQERAWAQLRGKYVVEVPAGQRRTSVAEGASVDWDAAFGRSAPLMVEIGSGTGDTLVALASSEPGANIVGFEVFLPCVASTLSALDRAGAENVRVVVADGCQGLETLFAAGSLTELWTFFPDPWHKARHHKRRLVSPAFARLAADRLATGGRWRLATDWDDYAAWMVEVIDTTPGLANEFDGWAPRWERRPVTRFEQRAIAAGRTVRDLVYAKVGDAPRDMGVLSSRAIPHTDSDTATAVPEERVGNAKPDGRGGA
jgi:tRNA (guanine-N7-)-methyltransferase